MSHDNETGEHYVPPEVQPIRITDPINGLALIGVIGAPLVFVLVGMLARFQTLAIGTLCVLIFVASFVTLVVRAQNRPRQDDGWDDGAVL